MDGRYIDAGIAHIVKAVNFVPGVDNLDGMANRRMDENSLKSTLWFSLLRFSGRETRIWFELVVSSLVSFCDFTSISGILNIGIYHLPESRTY